MATQTKTLKSFGLKSLIKVNNAIAARYEDIPKVTSSTSKSKAVSLVEDALSSSGEKIIIVLNPDYKKRGSSAKRSLALYRNGMIVSEYADAIEKAGFDRAMASADLRWDTKLGTIRLV